MSKSSDVVETLLSLDEGDKVWAEAERYEWSRPFEVEDVERVEWETIDGSFVSARCRLNPGSSNGNPREWAVVEGGDPPELDNSRYGALETIERVDKDEAEADKDEDEDETLGDEAFVAAVERCDSITELQDETGYGSEKLLRELGRHDLDDVLLGDVELSDLSEFDFDGEADDEGNEENEVESESATTGTNAGEPTADWLARPAQEIVATEDIDHNLGAILDATEVGGNIGQVAYELDKRDPPRGDVASVLWELGLRQKNGQLHDEETLQERIEALREVRP